MGIVEGQGQGEEELVWSDNSENEGNAREVRETLTGKTKSLNAANKVIKSSLLIMISLQCVEKSHSPPL